MSLGIIRASRYATPGKRFNPAMLATARQAQSMSQADVAEELAISQALVGKWEAGLSEPDDQQVDSLANVLRIQPEFFFVDRGRRLASMSDFYHRALSTASRTDVKAIHARCSIIDIQVDRLLEVVEMPKDKIPANIELRESDDYEAIALRTREAMGIGSGPIQNLVKAIEDCGGIVIDRKLEVDDVDALCRWVPELPKLFFINGARPADRIRFSLAHELGHTILHFNKDEKPKDAEDQANGFASAFLLPAKELRRDIIGHLSLSDLATLKRKWRVSMQAIAMRAHDLGIINDDRFRSILIQMSRKGWRKVEPVEIDGETPRHFAYLLHANLQKYSREELAKMLFVTPKDIEDMIADCDSPKWEDHGVRLRLVR